MSHPWLINSALKSIYVNLAFGAIPSHASIYLSHISSWNFPSMNFPSQNELVSIPKHLILVMPLILHVSFLQCRMSFLPFVVPISLAHFLRPNQISPFCKTFPQTRPPLARLMHFLAISGISLDPQKLMCVPAPSLHSTCPVSAWKAL